MKEDGQASFTRKIEIGSEKSKHSGTKKTVGWASSPRKGEGIGERGNKMQGGGTTLDKSLVKLVLTVKKGGARPPALRVLESCLGELRERKCEGFKKHVGEGMRGKTGSLPTPYEFGSGGKNKKGNYERGANRALKALWGKKILGVREIQKGCEQQYRVFPLKGQRGKEERF